MFSSSPAVNELLYLTELVVQPQKSAEVFLPDALGAEELGLCSGRFKDGRLMLTLQSLHTFLNLLLTTDFTLTLMESRWVFCIEMLLCFSLKSILLYLL